MDQPTILYVVYSMVSVQQEQTFCSNIEARSLPSFAFDKRLLYVTAPGGNGL